MPPLNPLNTGSVSVWRVAIVPIQETGRRRFRVDVVEGIAIYVRMRGDSAGILACARMTNWMAGLAPGGGNVACFCVGASLESILKCCWLGISPGATVFPHPWTPAPYRGTGHAFDRRSDESGGHFHST